MTELPFRKAMNTVALADHILNSTDYEMRYRHEVANIADATLKKAKEFRKGNISESELYKLTSKLESKISQKHDLKNVCIII